jgi:hypothetical protein
MATSTGDMTPESPDTTECLTEAYAALALAEIHSFGSLTAGKEPDEEVTEEIIKRFDQVMSVAARLALQLAPKGERAVLEEMLRAALPRSVPPRPPYSGPH